MTNEEQSKNGSTALVKMLNQLNLPTLAMIMLMGGGNWFAIDRNRGELDHLRQEVRAEISEIHRNQDQYLDNVRRVKENQELLRQILQIQRQQQNFKSPE